MQVTQQAYSNFHDPKKIGSKSITVNGRTFESINHAAMVLNVSSSTLSRHVKTLNKSSFKTLDVEMFVKTKIVLSKLKPEDNQEL